MDVIFSPVGLSIIAGIAIIAGMIWLQGYATEFFERYRQRVEKETQAHAEAMWISVAPDVLMFYKFASAVTLGIIFFLLLFDSPFVARILVTLFVMVVGFFLPDKYFQWQYKKRLDLFNSQLVDGLSIMSNALRSGMSFTQALDILTKEMEEPISIEFSQVMQDVKLGKNISESLQEMCDRVPIDDLRILVTAITIVRESGGNLAEIFDNLSNTIRERQRIQGRIDSLTAQGKLQAIIVCLMPLFIGLAMFVIDPSLIRPMWHTWPGLILLGIMFFLQYLGYFFILRVCTIDI